MLRSVDISVMNTKGADDDIENSDDEDDSNGDIVEDIGGLVMFRVVDVQTGQHQKQYPCQDLKDKRLILWIVNCRIYVKRQGDLEDDACDDEDEKDSVELVLHSYL